VDLGRAAPLAAQRLARRAAGRRPMSAAAGVLARCRAWEPGPILIKEARQSVRSRALPVMLCAALLVLAGHGLLQLAALSPAADRSAGAEFFYVTLVLIGLLELVLALLLFWRHARENVPGHRDLLYITTLRPHQIVRGKLLAAMVFSACLFAASLPFLALAYCLRGVDLPAMACGTGILLVLITLWHLLGILVAAWTLPLYAKVLLWLAGMFGLHCLLGCELQALNAELSMGLLLFLFLTLFAGGILYALAVSTMRG